MNTKVNALRIFQSVISKVFEGFILYYFIAKEQEVINEQFPTCESIFIDYAIMEKADEIFVFPSNFGWSDIGNWVALHACCSKDAHNNALMGNNIKM